MALKLKTKADYVRAHKKLWNGIIKELQTKELTSLFHNEITYIKNLVIFNLYAENAHDVEANCFGCHYSSLENYNGTCKDCLFAITLGKRRPSAPLRGCLNGLWGKITRAKNTKTAIRLAEQIRDFPVRKD